MAVYLLDTIFKDLKSIIASIEIKYDKTARENETVDSARDGDIYIAAMDEQDSFYTYTNFDIVAIQNAGILDMSLAAQYAANKNLIPKDKRNAILIQQRKLITSNYVERNDYYRMLNGLPNYGSADFVYIDTDIAIEYGLDPESPVHMYTDDEIVLLNKFNIITNLRAKYTDKKYTYLGYLGYDKISIYRARTARNFTILRMTKNISESFYGEFNDIYDQCREYFMSVIYNKSFGASYDLYDNFIALMVMVMTIQRVVSNSFKAGIEYDFYDLGSIQMVFNAYNVPFISNLSLEYQRILVRNLNKLLRYKSTDKVLYDICSLMGFERIQLYKYFLMKEHRLDGNDRPVFFYKEVDNGDGTTTVVEDHELMYNLYFQAVSLNERNVALALNNSANVLDYNQVVSEDPYWWDDDDDLRATLYDSEYNYVESKYLSMNIMYKLTEMLFEIMYFFRMLLDRKNSMSAITIKLPKLFDEKEIGLFDIAVLLCAMIAKKNNMVGNIICTPSGTLSLLGFNFHADFAAIRKYITDNPTLIDNAVLQYINNMRVIDTASVNELYSNIRELNDFLVNAMATTQDIRVYQAYKKLHTALMITQHTENVFVMKNGELAKTFLEYLMDRDSTLGIFVTDTPVEALGDFIDHILSRLNNAINDLKYLNIINDSNSATLNATITLIRFFKSYTTDLTSLNILYLMDSRYYNMIKLISAIQDVQANISLYERQDEGIVADNDGVYRANIGTKDVLEFLDRYSFKANISKEDLYEIVDSIPSVSKEQHIRTLLTFRDKPYLMAKIIMKNYLIPEEKVLFSAGLYHNEKFMRDHYQMMNVNTSINKDLSVEDRHHATHAVIDQYDSQLYSESQTYSSDMDVSDKRTYQDKISDIAKIIDIGETINISYGDIINILNKQLYAQDKKGIKMSDKITLIWEN